MSGALDLATIERATREGNILVVRCAQCGAEQCLPAPSCLRCGSQDIAARTHAGDGVLYSWSVTGTAFEPELAAEVPYVVAVVLLSGGAKIWSRLAGVDPATAILQADMPVQIDSQLTKERGFLVFRPSDGAMTPKPIRQS